MNDDYLMHISLSKLICFTTKTKLLRALIGFRVRPRAIIIIIAKKSQPVMWDVLAIAFVVADA